ncbi:MAG: ATP phosphoribosyltransferase regulatory subunit [Oscillatoria princeps RMCB-10]|jgi:ATP phosphoribosyltransferase regulatory subunit|nr:ATP phosphoribosyltransferase regulatory subunit [Oscillatoria princeps RMCB-10]
MVYQPPMGARDLLPLDVAQKYWIEERLRLVFRRWGYHWIITSTLERLDTLMAGGAIQPSTVIQVYDEDEVLGLRPELTASIARAAVTRMAGATYPLRLYYIANVFRRAGERIHGGQQEFYQAGVELLGAGGLMADAEILLLLSDCLQSLGLSRWRVILGEAGLMRSLLSAFPPALQDTVRHAIANLDRVTLETLPLTPELRERALLLFDLRGRPADVLQRVGSLDLDSHQRQIVNTLKSLIELLDECSPAGLPAILDLSLIQTFDYYTGIVFEVVSETDGGQRVLGQGGRYDQLLGLYDPQGQTAPGIGFCLNIEDLQQVLQPTGKLPEDTAPCDWLVVPVAPHDSAAAFAHAQKLRESGELVRVEVELGLRDTPESLREYAQRRGIKQIARVRGAGEPEIETLS